MVLLLFLAAALTIAIVGVRITKLADNLADRTRLGEAVVGGVLLGASTSLSGTVASVSAALDGLASLAVSNSIGGICAQTAFLVIADAAYRGTNLEHAAADEKNMLQTSVLILLLGVAIAAYLTPPLTIWGIHPVSILLVAIYALGVRGTMSLKKNPMWRPEKTTDTKADEPDSEAMSMRLTPLLTKFVLLSLLLAIAGYVISKSGAQISRDFGISQTVVGTLLTAVATSLPELVTTLAAVRQGAVQLAVGGIVGGNTFDVLFLSFSDVAYRNGSIYHAMAERDALLLAAAVIITAVLLIGLILRDRKGIGFEGVSILSIYAGLIMLQIYLG